MQNKRAKIVFIVVVIGAVSCAAFFHPSFFILGNASTTSANNAGDVAGKGSSTVAPPLLSADIAAQAPGGSPTSGIATIVIASTTAGNAATIPPNVGSEAALITDLTTGAHYLDINASERWPMASISKLMTAVVATNVLSQNAEITITPQMVAVDPTQKILQVGDTYSVPDLLKVMLLPSDNVAAEAFAEFYGRDRFLAAMNAQAQAWGMANTFYDDPSGLSAANESTAEDLLKLAQHIYTDYPQILAITRTSQVTVQNIATGKPVIVKSINNFAGQPDFIGGKTGYTDQADGNLLSIFEYNSRPIFVVVLGIGDGVRFDATQELYNWFKANFD
jgi:D-alanyl-D-alanine carboxypeptidase